MNVLMVHHDKGIYGGAEEVVRQLADYLDNRWHKVMIVYESNPVVLWGKAQQWVRWADVINVHNFPATLAVCPSDKPIVWMCNEPPELFTNWWRKPIEAFNRCWARRMKVVVADKFNADRFESIYKVKPTIIPYGVDYSFWSQGERNENGFTLLQVGHPELFDKGIEVFYKVREHIPKARLIQMMGATHEQIRGMYHTASVLIHPIGNQGGWLVPFEAMCAGLPVVVSSEFTGADMIRDNGLGCVTKDIALSISHETYKVINTGRVKHWVRDNLTWQRFGEKMVKVFEEAISERKGH